MPNSAACLVHPRTLLGALFPFELSCDILLHASSCGSPGSHLHHTSSVWFPRSVLRLLPGIVTTPNARPYFLNPAKNPSRGVAAISARRALGDDSVLISAAHTTDPGYFTSDRFLSHALVPFDFNGVPIVGPDAPGLVEAQRKFDFHLPFWAKASALQEEYGQRRWLAMSGSGTTAALDMSRKPTLIIPSGSTEGYYNASQFMHCGRLTPADCHCYAPHTIYASFFPSSVSRLMSQTAMANGWPAALWLTLEQAHMFGAELDAASCGASTRTPLWVSEMTPGRLEAFYCASQFKRSAELLPTLRELQLLASGVPIARAKLAGYPHLASSPGAAVAHWQNFEPTAVAGVNRIIESTKVEDADPIRVFAILSNEKSPLFVRPQHFGRVTTSGMAVRCQLRPGKPYELLLVPTSTLKDSRAMEMVIERKFVHAGINAQLSPWSQIGRDVASHAARHKFTSRFYFPDYFAELCGLQVQPGAIPVSVVQKMHKTLPEQVSTTPAYSARHELVYSYYNLEQFTDTGLASKIAEYKPLNYRFESYEGGMRILLKVAAAQLGCLHERMWVSETLVKSDIGNEKLLSTVNVCRDIARNAFMRFYNVSEFADPDEVRRIVRLLPAQEKVTRSAKRLAANMDRRSKRVWRSSL
jgi:hypothetical protein